MPERFDYNKLIQVSGYCVTPGSHANKHCPTQASSLCVILACDTCRCEGSSKIRKRGSNQSNNNKSRPQILLNSIYLNI